MSTILKALKRIDQTSPPPEDLQAWPPKIDTKKALKARVHKIWLYRKVSLALFLTVMLITAGWLVYSQKHWLASKRLLQKTSANGPIYQAKIYPESDESKDSVPKKEPALKRQILEPSEGIQPPGTNITAKSNISRSPMADSEKSIQRDTRPSAAAPTKKSTPRVAPAARSYQRLDDTQLKLQAIAWSKEAAQRIAVINGRIVREGESVGGFLVNQIRQEDVVVNDGSASWQLEFGLK